MSNVIPRSYFDQAFYSNTVSAIVNGVSTLLHNTAPKTFASATPRSRDSEVSVFDIMALVLKDESLDVTSMSEPSLPLILKTKSETIRR